MDSITQATLGAAVGEVVLGKKVGNKAILWGAVAGTLPDLDILAYPLMDQIDQLSWHRGPSHAFFFLILGAPILGWLINKIHRADSDWRKWTLLVYLAFITHIILDAFTIYGTQLFQPFSNWPVALDSISIIDPLYTVPLIMTVLIALFFRKSKAIRRYLVIGGLTLSTSYLVLTYAFKAQVDNIARNNFENQNIPVHRFISTPTIFNSILWRVTAEVDSGFYVGYYSLLDKNEKIDFSFINKNDSLLNPYRNTEAVKRIKWFSRGFYVVQNNNGQLNLADIRFGTIDAGQPESRRYIFKWLLENSSDNPNRGKLTRLEFQDIDFNRALSNLWVRLQGK